MNYETIQSLSDWQLKRLVGIEWSTFHAMLKVLEGNQSHKGRPHSISCGFERWRE